MSEELIQQGWRDHADDPEGVLQRLAQAVPDPARSPGDRARLAHLIAHVAGDHLGRWGEGLSLLEGLSAAEHVSPDTAPGRSLLRSRAALLLGADRGVEAEAVLERAGEPDQPSASARVRVFATAAAALAQQGQIARARQLLAEATEAAAYGPTAADPAARSLAITGNNLALTLEELPDREPAQTELMKTAAALARTWWAVAGDWRNVMLAEVRLCATHLAAGEPSIALAHAREAMSLTEGAQAAGPDDRIAALLALAEAQQRLGARAEARVQLTSARGLLGQLEPELAGWYRPLLERLEAEQEPDQGPSAP